MTRGLTQAPASGIGWKWRGTGVALRFFVPCAPPRNRRRAKLGDNLAESVSGHAVMRRSPGAFVLVLGRSRCMRPCGFPFQRHAHLLFASRAPASLRSRLVARV